MFGKKALGSQMEEAIKAAGGEAVTHGVRSKYVTAEQMERLIAAISAGGGGGGGSSGSSVADGGCIGGYVGKDLSQSFENAAALHTAVAAGDFSKIHIGDYWPITLDGTFYDAGTSSNKSINETVKMEVAAINPYIHFCDPELTSQHILMCSKDCLSTKLKYRASAGVWHDSEQANPWLGSSLYATLNDSNNGIIKLLEGTPLGPYIFKGPNDKGMKTFMVSMAAGADVPAGGTKKDRGRLFLPEEAEVYGFAIRDPSTNEIARGLFNQWPIFAGSSMHISKGIGNGGSVTWWWLETAAKSTRFALVDPTGYASQNGDTSALGVPLCFLLT